MAPTPERPAKGPPSAASTSGAAPRAVAAASSARTRMLSLIAPSSRAFRHKPRGAGERIGPSNALALILCAIEAGKVELGDRALGLKAARVAALFVLQAYGLGSSGPGGQGLQNADRDEHVHRAPLLGHGQAPARNVAQALAARSRGPHQRVVCAGAEPPGRRVPPMPPGNAREAIGLPGRQALDVHEVVQSPRGLFPLSLRHESRVDRRDGHLDAPDQVRARAGRRKSASSGARSACSRAPQTRMISPWITT